jgi:hypothetical protein
MVFCSYCGFKCDDNSRFCPDCGKSLIAKPIQNSTPLSSKWKDAYFSGRLKSNNGELWTYNNGNITCDEGNFKGSLFQWNGSEFISENKELPIGTFDGKKLEWKFPQQKEIFYSYNFIEKSNNIFYFQNQSGMLRTNPVRYTSFVHWILDKNIMKIEEGCDQKEGTANFWEVMGDIPPPVILFISMCTYSQKLLEDAIQRSKRQYKRCGKLVLQSTGTPMLCNKCIKSNGDYCIVCDNECTNEKFYGKICKSCFPKKSFCAKCGDPFINKIMKEGFLCKNCGLGKLSNNCCKMIYTIN